MTSTPDRAEVRRYSQQLLLALRAREVSSERIAEVVAEVESHVAETGEAPQEAFGTPGEYARTIAGRPRPTRATLGALVLGGLTGWLVAQLVFALVRQDSSVHGVPTWVVAPATLVLAAITVLAAQRRYRPVRDPRSGEQRLTGGGRPLVAVLALGAGAIALLGVSTALLGD